LSLHEFVALHGQRRRPDLPAFPTRRSSDLLSAERTAQLNAQAAHNIACIQSWIDQGLMARVDPNHLLFSIWAATQTYADFDWQIDRKSTRLNSSHVKISYAVFCLKKKKRIP